MAEPCSASVEYARDTITQCVETMRREAPGVRNGKEKSIHAMRVASRRLRAALDAFSPYLDADALAGRAGEVTKTLGRIREVDVLIDLLETWRKDYNPPWNFAAGHAAGALREERLTLLTQCEAAAALVERVDFVLPETATRTDGPCLCDHMPGVLQAQYDEARAAFKHWRDTKEDEDLHQLRIVLKKLRYTCEHFGPHYGKKLAKFTSKLGSAQDGLGQWHDWTTVRDTLARHETGAPYRAAQGFPELIRDAEIEIDDGVKDFRKAARGLFDKEARKMTARMFFAPKLECCNTAMAAKD